MMRTRTSLPPYAIAAGAAEYAGTTSKTYTVILLLDALERPPVRRRSLRTICRRCSSPSSSMREFKSRHSSHDVMTQNVTMYEGRRYLGIDCGSTTTKLVLIGEDDQILFHHYQSNKGNPADVIREQLTKLYELCGDRVHIVVLRRSRATAKRIIRTPSAWISVWSRRSRISARHAILTRMLISSSTLAVRTSSASRSATNASTIFRSTRPARPAAARLSRRSTRSMGYSIEEFCKLGLFAKHPDRPRLALYGVHEQFGQAGAEGRRRNRRDLGRSVRVGRQERALQGHPCPFAR